MNRYSTAVVVHAHRRFGYTLSDNLKTTPSKNFVRASSGSGGELDELDEQINRIIAKVRAKVEHPFRILKRQFGHVKNRYRGLAKNRAHLFTMFALGNLFLMRRRLAA